MTVTLYQPQRGIHRPVVVGHAPSNFANMKILVRCVAHKDYLPAGDASKLCGGLARDFERQGAETEWVVPSGQNYEEPEVFEGAPPDLTIEIQSKIDHSFENPMMGYLSCLTLTMIPTLAEQTFSQRVVVYGRDRSVLGEEILRERFVQYNGCAVWSFNYLLDWLFRSDANDLSGNAGMEDFTKDFYGQIRQLTFNARVRSELLGLTPRRARAKADVQADMPGETSVDMETDVPTDTSPDAQADEQSTLPTIQRRQYQVIDAPDAPTKVPADAQPSGALDGQPASTSKEEN